MIDTGRHRRKQGRSKGKGTLTELSTMEEALEHFVHGLPTVLCSSSSPCPYSCWAKQRICWWKRQCCSQNVRGSRRRSSERPIVSLGTTTPEAAVSVFAADTGSAGLALGNAVGSIICDTGLILGVGLLDIAAQARSPHHDRQGWIQIGAAAVMVALSFPWSSPAEVFSSGGNLSQWPVLFFLAHSLSTFGDRFGGPAKGPDLLVTKTISTDPAAPRWSSCSD